MNTLTASAADRAKMAMNASAYQWVTPRTMVQTPKMATAAEQRRADPAMDRADRDDQRHRSGAEAGCGAQPAESECSDVEPDGDRRQQGDRAAEEHGEEVEGDRAEQDRLGADEAQALHRLVDAALDGRDAVFENVVDGVSSSRIGFVLVGRQPDRQHQRGRRSARTLRPRRTAPTRRRRRARRRPAGRGCCLPARRRTAARPARARPAFATMDGGRERWAGERNAWPDAEREDQKEDRGRRRAAVVAARTRPERARRRRWRWSRPRRPCAGRSGRPQRPRRARAEPPGANSARPRKPRSSSLSGQAVDDEAEDGCLRPDWRATWSALHPIRQ